MQNLQFLRTVTGPSFKSYGVETLLKLAKERAEYVYKQALKFFTKEEVDQAASNRRSDYSDEALIADFMSFEQPRHVIPKDTHFWDAFVTTKELFQPNRMLHPVAYPDLRYYPWNLRPSAEAPWTLPSFRFRPTLRNVDYESEIPKLRQRLDKLAFWMDPTAKMKITDYLRIKHALGLTDNASPSFHNLYPEIFHFNRTLIHQIKDGSPPFWNKGTPVPYYWHTLHARSHVVSKDEPDKIRAVFGCPKLVLQAENMFIWPLQATYLNTEAGRMLWGREMIRGGWRKLFSEIHEEGNPSTVMTIDWSQFDKRLQFELITFVHMIWRTYFDFSKYEPTSFYPHASTDPSRIENLWNWMTYIIKYTPICLPNGELWMWLFNGFGSGYQQTQLMDSFANMIMILTVLSALGVNIKSKTFWIRVQGDDSLIRFFEHMHLIYGPGFMDKLSESALYYFNAKLNVKKSEISDRVMNLTVLGYFTRFGLPYRTDEDLLRHLMYPEGPRDWDTLYSSVIGLAYASLGCSERFYSLCKYIKEKMENKDKYILEERPLQWMIRTGLLTEDAVETILTQPMPSRINLRSTVWIHTPRTNKQKERLWPTEPGSHGNFYFLQQV